MGIVQHQHARLIESHKLQTVHHGTIMRYILEVYRRYERALMLACSHSPLCPLKVLQLAGRAALQRVMLLRSLRALQVAEVAVNTGGDLQLTSVLYCCTVRAVPLYIVRCGSVIKMHVCSRALAFFLLNLGFGIRDAYVADSSCTLHTSYTRF